jgi:hypothetical protein
MSHSKDRPTSIPLEDATFLLKHATFTVGRDAWFTYFGCTGATWAFESVMKGGLLAYARQLFGVRLGRGLGCSTAWSETSGADLMTALHMECCSFGAGSCGDIAVALAILL